LTTSWTRALAIIGSLIVIQTIVWELVRMKPDYRFLVSPWSLRGYEFVNGWAYMAIGIALLIGVLLVLWRGSERLAIGIAIIFYMISAAVAIGLIFGEDPVEVTEGLAGLLARAITILFTGTALSRVIRPGLAVLERTVRTSLGLPLKVGKHGEAPLLVERGPGRFLIWALSMVVAALGLIWVFNTIDVALEVWFAVLVGGLIMAAYSVTAAPRKLAPSRMLVLMVVFAAVIMLTMAGAMRSSLVEAQVEAAEGPAADYEDTQVAAGYFVALIGMTLVFLGSVAMWARRKDILDTQARAERQRRAAEESAREIEEARVAAGIGAAPAGDH
jgi:hypothetical protein